MPSHPFDLFRKEHDAFIWFGCAATMVEARNRIAEDAKSSSGEYLIVDEVMGDKIRILTGTPKQQRTFDRAHFQSMET